MAVFKRTSVWIKNLLSWEAPSLSDCFYQILWWGLFWWNSCFSCHWKNLYSRGAEGLLVKCGDGKVLFRLKVYIHTVNACVAVEQFLVMQKAEQHRIHMPSCQCDSHFSQRCIPDRQVLAAGFAPCDNYCFILLHKTQPGVWTTACWVLDVLRQTEWLLTCTLATATTTSITGNTRLHGLCCGQCGALKACPDVRCVRSQHSSVSHITVLQVLRCFIYIAVTFLFLLVRCSWG